MLIYLLALPIWNGILPAYAYWKFDDFSWGDTRKTAGAVGGKKEGGHGDEEGEFDSSKIVMRRWVDFEQERRGRGGVAAPGAGGGGMGSGAGAGVRNSSAWNRQAGPPSAWNKNDANGRDGRRSSRSQGRSGSRSRSRGRFERVESQQFV